MNSDLVLFHSFVRSTAISTYLQEFQCSQIFCNHAYNIIFCIPLLTVLQRQQLGLLNIFRSAQGIPRPPILSFPQFFLNCSPPLDVIHSHLQCFKFQYDHININILIPSTFILDIFCNLMARNFNLSMTNIIAFYRSCQMPTHFNPMHYIFVKLIFVIIDHI